MIEITAKIAQAIHCKTAKIIQIRIAVTYCDAAPKTNIPFINAPLMLMTIPEKKK